MTDRLSRILNIVNENRKVEVTKLSELLDVSQVTIRKDLDALSEKGLINREHGYAVLNESDDINNRLAINYDVKLKIARSAAETVSNGETIMIESGSICAIFAEELAKSKKEITIISNSSFIASYLRQYSNCKMILLGGEYQKESQVNVGPITKLCAEQFYVDKLFIGIDGFSPTIGFMGADMMRAEAVKSMAASANKIVILSDSTKFARHGVVSLFQLRDIDTLYTDDGIPKEIQNTLDKKGTRSIIV